MTRVTWQLGSEWPHYSHACFINTGTKGMPLSRFTLDSRPQISAHSLHLLTGPPSAGKIHQFLTIFVATQCTSWKDLSKSPSHFPEKGGPASQHATTSWPMVSMLPERPAQGRPRGKGEAPFQVKPHENFVSCHSQVVFLLYLLVIPWCVRPGCNA